MAHRTLQLALLISVFLGTTAIGQEDGKPRELRGHTGSVTGLAFVGGGKVLASGASDKRVRLWDVASGKERAILAGHRGSIESLASNRAGEIVASGDAEGVVKVWNVATAKEHASLPKQQGAVSALALSPDGTLLASGGGGVDDRTNKGFAVLKLWDVARGKERAVLEGHETRVFSLAFSGDGKALVSGSADGTVILWDVDPPRKRTILGKNPQGASRVLFSPDGKTVVCGSFTRSTLVKFWDTASGKEARDIDDPVGPSLLSLAFFPDGRTLAVGGMQMNTLSDPNIQGAYLALYDVDKRAERVRLLGTRRAVLALALSDDGKVLASGGMDQIIRLWDVADRGRK